MIREAVKQGLSLTREPGSVHILGDDQEEVNEEPRKDVTMLETEMKSLEMVGKSGSPNLWRSGMILSLFVMFWGELIGR